MTTVAVDFSDFTLWCNGFPNDFFAELRRTRTLFRHDLTPGVARMASGTVQRDFWVTTKHRHAVRLHRDADSFTAVDGSLIEPVGLDPPGLNKRRKLISNAFNPRTIAKLEDGIRARRADDRSVAHRRRRRLDQRCCQRLPMTVIGDTIGMPESDRPRIFDSLDRILKARSPQAG